MEGSEAPLIAADHLSVEQAGPHLEMIYGLYDEREPVGPVVASPSQQPNAYRVTPGHQAVAVVLDLVNPVGAGRRAVGR